MAMLLLVNTSKEEVLAMYDGEPYLLPARGAVFVQADAARHISDAFSSRGIVLVASQEEADNLLSGISAEEAEDDGNLDDEHGDESDGSGVVTCPECGEDFSGKKRPGRALMLHRRRAHATV